MKLAIPILGSLFLSACQSTQSVDPSKLSFRVPAGSSLSLNREIEIPEGQTHIMMQSGQLTSESNRNQYDVACRLNFREFGPRTVAPEVFSIRRTEHREGWESRPNFYFYASEIYLDSAAGTDVIKLECDTWAMPPSINFSFADMQEALGDYLTFKYSSPETPEK